MKKHVRFITGAGNDQGLLSAKRTLTSVMGGVAKNINANQ